MKAQVLGIAFLVSGCGQAPAHSRASTGALLCPGTSPQAVARLYYQAVNEQWPAAAKACLTRHYLVMAERPSVVGPDWTNVTAARLVRLTSRPIGAAILPSGIRPLPYRAVQVGAEVLMQYRRIGGSPNGLDTWFIYVIKQYRSSPWRIAEIDGGP